MGVQYSSGTTPLNTDPERVLWAKILNRYRALTGQSFDPLAISTYTKRQIIEKLLKSINEIEPTGGPYARVQSNYAYGATSLAFSSNNAAGNCILVGASISSIIGANISSVSDTQGNVYVQVADTTNAFVNSGIWAAFNVKAGANTVSAAISGTPNTSISISVVEYSGVTGLDTSHYANPFNVASFKASVTTYYGLEMFYALYVGQQNPGTITTSLSPGGVTGSAIHYDSTNWIGSYDWLNNGTGFPINNYAANFTGTGNSIASWYLVALR